MLVLTTSHLQQTLVKLRTKLQSLCRNGRSRLSVSMVCPMLSSVQNIEHLIISVFRIVFSSCNLVLVFLILVFLIPITAIIPADRFADSDHCIGWISSGAWMGSLAFIVLTFWLVMAILALLNTSTPDRFETQKSKCLVIPHEH